MDSSKNLFDLDQDKLSELIQSIKAKQTEFGLNALEFTFHKQLIQPKTLRKQAIFVFEGVVSSSLKPKVQEFENEVQKILQGFNGQTYVFEVESGIGAGEQFPTLDNLKMLPSKEEKTFACPSGEVVLVDFWATWCGPCQRPMAHNQEMLEKNEEKWKGKARIVGISLDDSIEDVEKRVNERNWHKVEHYHAPGGFRSPAASQFGISGIPCVFLVDKKGIIRFRGHPASCNLEEEINKLIEEKEDANATTTTTTTETKKEETIKKASISLAEESECNQKFNQIVEENKQLIESLQGFTCGLIGSRVFKEGSESFSGRIYLSGLLSMDKKDIAIQLIKKLQDGVSKEYKLDNRIGLNEIPEIHVGTSCANCKKTLGEGVPHYVCTKCQCDKKDDYAFCVECADVELTKEIKSGNDLFHPHGLLFIHEKAGPNSLKTLARVLNKAEIVQDDDPDFKEILEEKACTYIICDGCRQSPLLNCRWACANCHDYDFCSECLKIIGDPNHEKHAQLVEESKKKGHDPSHVYYRAHFLMMLRRDDPKPLEL